MVAVFVVFPNSTSLFDIACLDEQSRNKRLWPWISRPGIAEYYGIGNDTRDIPEGPCGLFLESI